MITNRKEMIKSKGFSINMVNDTDDRINRPFETVDFAKIRVGAQYLNDAVLNIGTFSQVNKSLSDKVTILKAIQNRDFIQLREISDYFFATSLIYSRLCRYMAYLYKYDWMVTPYINDESEKTKAKALQTFHHALLYLDNSEIKKTFGEIALKVIKQGCYYGYLIPQKERMVIQELPANYCRSRFSVMGRPAIEFNMKYFDVAFKDAAQRAKILNLFPAEFKKGYILYKEGKLEPQFAGDTIGWYLLSTDYAIKFNLNGEDLPMFASVIPAILDLDEAKGLDKKKLEQELLKIIIQKMPLDKNGELIFDVDEAQQLHNNAVRMLSKAIGIDVLTTFADVEVADMSSNRAATAADDLERYERAIYNEAGVSQMQFNTDGNIALEKSIANDEASMYNLISQFEAFLNYVIKKFNTNPNKYYYRVQLLLTTIYNYKDLAKLYKEQTQIGYSKMLPQIALGQAQSTVLANAYFENDVLDLVHVFIPPLMSSTMNADALAQTSENKGGRPSKESQGEPVTEKTIQNKESQN